MASANIFFDRAVVNGRPCSPSQNNVGRIVPEHAAGVMREAGYEPREDYPGNADTPWPSRCRKCSAHVTPTYSSARDGHGCRYCAARERGKQRRLEHDVAADVMRAAELEPLENYSTATEPWRCRCERCKTILVSLTYAKVQSGRGCHVCRPPATGFDRTAPGAVYVLQHDQLAAVKIGVTVVGAERIRQHQRHGWHLVYRLPCTTGEQAWRIEQGVLTLLRHAGIRPYLTAEYMPQGGFTETVNADLISAVRMWTLIRAEVANHSDGTLE